MSFVAKSVSAASFLVLVVVASAASGAPPPSGTNGGDVTGGRDSEIEPKSTPGEASASPDDESEGEGAPGEPISGAEEPSPAEARLAACVANHEQAQLARLSGHFLDARARLAECSSSLCPEALRSDCLVWQKELTSLIPTILVAVRGDAGDIETADVFVDDKLLRQRLDGRPIQLDPGTHLIRVTISGRDAQERRVVLSEGEQGRLVSFDLSPKSATPGAATPPKAAANPPPESATTRPIPQHTYVLAAGAVVSLGFAVGFGHDALTRARRAKSTCAPLCDPSVSRAIQERAILSDVALGVSVASLVGAVLVYAYRPKVDAGGEGAATETVALDLRSRQGGGELVVGGQF